MDQKLQADVQISLRQSQPVGNLCVGMFESSGSVFTAWLGNSCYLEPSEPRKRAQHIPVGWADDASQNTATASSAPVTQATPTTIMRTEATAE